MNPKEMEKAMMKNMLQKTGKPIHKWVNIIHNENYDTKAEIINFLKTEYDIGHFYAHLITKKFFD
jgi:hypothetical protein